MREWRPRAAGGSFYSSQNNSPYLANRFHWTFSALANQNRGFDPGNAANFNSRMVVFPRRYDEAPARQLPSSMGPTMMTHRLARFSRW